MTTSMNKNLFCFGYGYCAEYLSKDLQKDGWSIAGTTRDSDKKPRMADQGIKPHLFNFDHPLGDVPHLMRDVTHLLISIAPDDDGDVAFHMHGHDIARLESLEWVGYFSATSVYGDRGGDWVDETSELRPTSKRGSRRVVAERQWLSLLQDHGVPVHIFRLAGIYGPGRSAIDAVRAGSARRIDKPGHAFSRIHIDDIVQVVEASMLNPDPGTVYNLADDNAAPSHEVIAYACHLLGVDPLPVIPFEEADMAPIARSFYMDNKRINNTRIKEDLGVSLKYPDYRSGLQACLDHDQAGHQDTSELA